MNEETGADDYDPLPKLKGLSFEDWIAIDSKERYEARIVDLERQVRLLIDIVGLLTRAEINRAPQK